MHLSARLPSGTYAMSAAAGERLSEGTGKKVTVIDSWSAYMGEGLMVIDGPARLRRELPTTR